MKLASLGITFMLLIFTSQSYAQNARSELEDISLIQESFRSNTISGVGGESPRLLLMVTMRDLDRHGLEYIGLDPQRDAEAIERLSSVEFENIEREAVEPYMNEICSSIESGNSSAVELAALYMRAENAQEQAIAEKYEAFWAALSPAGQASIEKNDSEVQVLSAPISFFYDFKPCSSHTEKLELLGFIHSDDGNSESRSASSKICLIPSTTLSLSGSIERISTSTSSPTL